MQNKWDGRFMERAQLISTWSKDRDHQVGAVIVDQFNRVKGEGYNGPPCLVKDSGLTRESDILRTLHAEVNAVLHYLNNVPRPGGKYTMYVYPFLPCAQCAAVIIQAGIAAVKINSGQLLPSWRASQNEAVAMFEEAGVEVTLVGID